MATEVGMYSATHESVTMPVGRDEIIRTAPRTNQIAGSVTALSDKKKTKQNKTKKKRIIHLHSGE